MQRGLNSFERDDAALEQSGKEIVHRLSLVVGVGDDERKSRAYAGAERAQKLQLTSQTDAPTVKLCQQNSFSQSTVKKYFKHFSANRALKDAIIVSCAAMRGRSCA